MREIKFRAYIKKTKVIRRVGEIYEGFFKGKDNDANSGIWCYYKNRNEGTSYNQGDVELMQYTGLKDKNGVDVYEGDVVDWKQSEPSNYEIQFIEGGFCLTRPELEGCTTDIASVYPSYGCQIEVIGNIYENPDLLTNN